MIEMQKIFCDMIEKSISIFCPALISRKVPMTAWHHRGQVILYLTLAALNPYAHGQSAPNDRGLWAYPRAVIVTHDGGKLWIPGADTVSSPPAAKASSKPMDKTAPPHNHTPRSEKPPQVDPSSGKTLTQALHVAEKDLLECVTDLRARKPDLVLATPTIALQLVLPVASDGVVASVDYEGRPLPPYFIECASRSMAFLHNIRFPPRLDQRTLMARVILETRFLRDDEAQGRGFQFFAAEEKWEESVKNHPEWFRCKHAKDCAVSNEHCEIRAVHKDYLDAYLAAIRERKRRYCPNPPDPSRYASACRAHTCRAIKQRDLQK